MLNMIEHCRSFSYMPYLGYHYRISGSSVSRRYNPQIVDIMEKTLGAYQSFVEKYDKGESFRSAVNRKYYKVMLGEYMQLYYIHPQNSKSERERIREFAAIVRREPYRSALEAADALNGNFYDRLILRCIRQGQFGRLFRIKTLEARLRSVVIHNFV